MGNQIFGGSNLVDEANPPSFLRVDHFPRQNKLTGLAFSNEARKPLSPPVAWNDPQVHLRLTESRSGGGDPQGTRQRHLASPTQCIAVDRGQDGLPQGFDPIE